MSPLADLVQARMDELGIPSMRALAKECGVSHHSVAALMADRHTPRDSTLTKLAAGLRVPVGRLREAADQPRGEEEPYVPPEVASQLTYAEREIVDSLIVTLVRHRRERSDRGDFDHVAPASSHRVGRAKTPKGRHVAVARSDDHARR